MAWVGLVVGIAINDPPFRSIAISFGVLVVVTTVVRAFTRPLVR